MLAVELEQVAVAEESVTVLQIAWAPSLNVTLPVGVPEPDCGATVAV